MYFHAVFPRYISTIFLRYLSSIFLRYIFSIYFLEIFSRFPFLVSFCIFFKTSKYVLPITTGYTTWGTSSVWVGVKFKKGLREPFPFPCIAFDPLIFIYDLQPLVSYVAGFPRRGALKEMSSHGDAPPRRGTLSTPLQYISKLVFEPKKIYWVDLYLNTRLRLSWSNFFINLQYILEYSKIYSKIPPRKIKILIILWKKI